MLPKDKQPLVGAAAAVDQPQDKEEVEVSNRKVAIRDICKEYF